MRHNTLTLKGENPRELYIEMVKDLYQDFNYSFKDLPFAEGEGGCVQEDHVDQDAEDRAKLDPPQDSDVRSSSYNEEKMPAQTLQNEGDADAQQKEGDAEVDVWGLLKMPVKDEMDYGPDDNDEEPVEPSKEAKETFAEIESMRLILQMVLANVTEDSACPAGIRLWFRKCVEDLESLLDGNLDLLGGLPRRFQSRSVRKLAFCTSCLWRHHQFRQLIQFNAVMMALFAVTSDVQVSWSIVLAPDGQAGVLFEGLSNSNFCSYQTCQEKTSLESLLTVMELLQWASVEVDIGVADTTSTEGKFHMSWAKNSSHWQALSRSDEALLGELLLINLDADNLIGRSFCSQVCEALINPQTSLIHCKGYEPGTTGRVAIRASSFKELGGYDQEQDVNPSGYQDVDLIKRVTKYYSSTSLYYEVLLQYYSVLQNTTPALVCTTKYYSTTTLYYKELLQYYSVLQSTTPVLQNTTPVLVCTTKYYSSTTLYYKGLLQYKMLFQYYSVLLQY